MRKSSTAAATLTAPSARLSPGPGPSLCRSARTWCRGRRGPAPTSAGTRSPRSPSVLRMTSATGSALLLPRRETGEQRGLHHFNLTHSRWHETSWPGTGSPRPRLERPRSTARSPSSPGASSSPMGRRLAEGSPSGHVDAACPTPSTAALTRSTRRPPRFLEHPQYTSRIGAAMPIDVAPGSAPTRRSRCHHEQRHDQRGLRPSRSPSVRRSPRPPPGANPRVGSEGLQGPGVGAGIGEEDGRETIAAAVPYRKKSYHSIEVPITLETTARVTAPVYRVTPGTGAWAS